MRKPRPTLPHVPESLLLTLRLLDATHDAARELIQSRLDPERCYVIRQLPQGKMCAPVLTSDKRAS